MDYLTTCIDQVNEFNDILQLVIVELVYKVTDHTHTHTHTHTIDHSVRYVMPTLAKGQGSSDASIIFFNRLVRPSAMRQRVPW